MKRTTREQLSTAITEELMANGQARVTFEQTGMNRAEMSQFIDSYLCACTQNYEGGNVYADPTVDGCIVYEN
ncbi:hypothetical protein [Fontibacillus sp. BL9]|uniref:hypothetical protein n=1 Tax=Fontibacillus sp. BL9 TaxID=3389971 RepID=UPI003979419D